MAILVALVYGNSFSKELVFDATTIVGEDPRIRSLSGENLQNIVTKSYWWPTMPTDLYRPVTTATYLINYAILGNQTRPHGYQAVNIVLHWGLSVCVFLVATRLGLRPRLALAAAAVFAVHPLGTEGVVNIVGRADQLAALAVLGTVYLALGTRVTGWSRRSLAGGIALVSLGILSKENAASALPILGLIGLMPLRSDNGDEPRPAGATWWRGALTCALPPVLLLGFTRWWFSIAEPGTLVPAVDNPLILCDWLAGRLTAMGVLVAEMGSLAFPFSPSADFSYNQHMLASGGLSNRADVLGWAATFGVALALLVLARQWKRGGGAGTLVCTAFAIALLPSSNLIVLIGSIRAERFLYLPLTFAVIAGAIGVARVVEGPLAADRLVRVRRWAGGALAVWGLALGVFSHTRTYDWRTNITLWEAGVLDAPDSYKPHANLGALLARPDAPASDLERALHHLERAREIVAPLPLEHQVGKTHTNLGVVVSRLGDIRLGEGDIAEATRLHAQAEAEFRTGLTVTDAIKHRFAAWLSARGVPADRAPVPYADHAMRSYAAFLTKQGRHGEALALLTELLALAPTDTSVRVAAARAAAADGDHSTAATHALWAIILGVQDGETVALAVEAIGPLSQDTEQPVARVESNGRPRLNIDNREVNTRVQSILLELEALYVSRNDPLNAARVRRSARLHFSPPTKTRLQTRKTNSPEFPETTASAQHRSATQQTQWSCYLPFH